MLAPNLPENKQMSLENFNHILQVIDPFSIQRWLIIIVNVLGTLVEMILCGTVYYLKYKRVNSMKGHFHDIFKCNTEKNYICSK